MRVTGDWSREQSVAFLESARVPVRLACHTHDGGLWMLSLWFRHRDGYLECATSATADVVSYLRADSGVSFEVSTNEPPYRGVRGAGVATVEPDEDKRLIRALLKRYLGGTDSELAAFLLSDEREEVRLRIDASRWHTWDFSDRMSDSDVPAGDPPA